MPAMSRRPSVTQVPGFALALALAALLTAAAPAGAQSLSLPRDKAFAAMLEVLRPSLEGVDGAVLSAAYFLSGRVCVSDGIALVGEIPYARFDGTVRYYPYGYPFYGFYLEDSSESAFGNPYFGFETRSVSTPLFLELGVRAPLASDTEWNALSHGQRADRLRWNAFASEVTSIQVAINLREESVNHVTYRLRLSPVLTLPKGYLQPDLWANYTFEIGYVRNRARIGAGISGTALVTGNGNLGARALNQFDLHGDFLGGAIRPGLTVRIPMGSAANSVPLVIGVTLAWVQ